MELADFGRRLAPTVKKLVFRPGALSRDYVDGLAGTQTHPVRLLVLAGAVAFLSSRQGWGALFVLTVREVGRGVGEGWAVWVVMLVLLPAAALLLFVLFQREDLPYLAHLVFAAHLTSFVLFLAALESIVRTVIPRGDLALAAASLFVAGSYSLLALRRFYGDSWWRIVAKSLFLAVAYLLALFAVYEVVA